MGDAAGQSPDALEALAVRDALVNPLALLLQAFALEHLGLECLDRCLELGGPIGECVAPGLELLLVGDRLHERPADGPAELVDGDRGP